MPHQAAVTIFIAAILVVAMSGMAPAIDAMRTRPGSSPAEVHGAVTPRAEGPGIEVGGHPVTLHGLEPLAEESRARLIRYVAGHGGELTCKELGRRRYQCRTATGWDPAAALLMNGEIRAAVDAPTEYLRWELTARRARAGIWARAEG
ncbi:MAG: hypothetical protein KIT81_17455 [Alphaproteobacteria bacterium]|nr:hypothetical protein [Alphaproteobacteria bacterium]